MSLKAIVDDPFAALSADRPAEPYPGLRSFEKHEWSIFFGRERMTSDVVEQLLSRRIVLVHGASGCGKSSLVRAGVQAELETLHARSGLNWRSSTMRPGSMPLQNLAAAIAGVAPSRSEALEHEVHRALNTSRGAAARVAELLALRPGERVCVIIDQFEELFRFTRESGADQAVLLARFLDSFTAQEDAPTGIYILVTMRSEFLGECARLESLASLVNVAHYLLPRMTTDDLLRAVRDPAPLYRANVEPQLAERIVADARSSQDELPLMQHALMRLWHVAKSADPHQADRKVVLRLSAYEEHGPLARLLDSHADDVMRQAGADEHGEPLVQDIFRALTDVNAEGAAIRRPQRLRELAAVAGVSTTAVRRVLDPFRAEGVSFVTPYAPNAVDDEMTIDISHEALIRCWRKIAEKPDGWLLKEFRDGVIWRALRSHAEAFCADPREVLSEAATESRRVWIEDRNSAWANRYGGEWNSVVTLLDASKAAAEKSRHEREQALLHQERARVAEERAAEAERLARTQADLATKEREARAQAEKAAAEAVRAAEAERRAASAERRLAVRRRWQTTVAAVGLVIMAAIATLAGYQWSLAETARTKAETAGIVATAATARAEAALAKARVANERAQTSNAASDATQRASAGIIAKQLLSPVLSVAWSPEGTRIVTASLDGTARV